ncbi:hypothetical protein FNV43_RR17498 [Rhamnella rubrinervis]|uniref:ZF-HD dimerization-type domain-containing protein n=1 Tax=Rhamnella rubrinervis TaxID=2594499 RepID=A0A8K0E1T5_9ROSA|nr:hypothetical protein FNV43_RR17498 [Rhamnella rubrinervis]
MEFEDQEEHDEEMELAASYDSALGNSETPRVKMATTGVGSEGGVTATAQAQPRKPRYRECLKNHAVGIGGHAVDGCGEFLAAGADGTLDALKCAACNCHRNFHRKESDSGVVGLTDPIASSLTTHHRNSLLTIGPQLGISTWLRIIGLWLCRRRPEVEGVIAGKTRRTCRIRAVAVEVGHRRRRGSEQSSRRSRRRGCWFWRRGLGGGFRSKTNRWSSSSATRLG